MNEEEIKEELGQHNDQLKIQDEAISELRRRVRLLTELWEKLLICGFTPTAHSQAAGEAQHRITAIIQDLRQGN